MRAGPREVVAAAPLVKTSRRCVSWERLTKFSLVFGTSLLCCLFVLFVVDFFFMACFVVLFPFLLFLFAFYCFVVLPYLCFFCFVLLPFSFLVTIVCSPFSCLFISSFIHSLFFSNVFYYLSFLILFGNVYIKINAFIFSFSYTF